MTDQEPETPRRRRSPWAIAGIVLAVVVGVAGLAVLALAVVVVVGLNQLASNK